MNVADFIAEFRRVTDDVKTDYLWEDEEIVNYLNDAVNEACERALLLEDRNTAATCSIALQAFQGDYALHPSVIKVKRLTFRGRALNETSVEAMDAQDPDWESRTGQPRQYICGQNAGLRLVPAPVAGESIALTVYRTPITALTMDDDTAEPEIPARHHMRLLSWVYRCAYLKQDSETLDRDKAERHERIFEASFGARPDANVMRKQRDRRPHVVRFGW